MSSETTHDHEAHEEVLASRTAKGRDVIHNNVLWALGAGVVPIPIVDVVAIMAVEVKLLKQLTDVYEVTFTEEIAKKIIGSLLVSVGSVGLGAAIGGSLAKLVPVLGSTLGAVSVPVFAGAFTHALGRIFQSHFEMGGTLLDFDSAAVRAHFKRELAKSKEEIARLQKELGAKVKAERS
jgi:uncharacterized protein (DUF697 family)